MPELPEVEWWRRRLAEQTVGKKWGAFFLYDPKLLRSGEVLLPELLGEEVLEVQRRGKWLVWALERFAVVVHLRMSGKFVFAAQPAQPPGRHVRARWTFDEGSVIDLVDPRTFATLDILERPELQPFWEKRSLGPEPYPQKRSAAWWTQRFQGARGAIKPALLQQKRVAGLGNILASELCWKAALDPELLVPNLREAKWEALATAASNVIGQMLAASEAHGLRYLQEGGSPEEAGLQVYARAGQPCPRCGAPIERFTQAGRSTYACKECQGV